MSSGQRKSLADKVADFDDPAPRDYDPEDAGFYRSSDEDSDAGNQSGGREHYETVG
jgi:protein AATF/BFR2